MSSDSEKQNPRRKFLTDVAAAAGGAAALGAMLPILGKAETESGGYLKMAQVRVLKNQTTERRDGRDVILDMEAYAPDGTSDVVRTFTRYVSDGDEFHVFCHRSASRFAPESVSMISGTKGGDVTVTTFDHKTGEPRQVAQPAREAAKLYPGLPDEERINLYLRDRQKEARP